MPLGAWILISALGFVSGFLGFAGIFALTTPEPGAPHPSKPVTLRGTLRILALIGFVGQVLTSALNSFGVQSFSVAESFDGAVWWIALSGLLGVAGIAAGYAELFYLRRFARRMPDYTLNRSTTRLIKAVTFVGVPWVLLGMGMILFTSNFAVPPSTPAATVGTPTGTTPPPSGTAAASSGTTPSPQTGAAATAPVAGSPTSTGPTAPAAGPAIVWVILIGFLGCFGSIAGIVVFLWYLRMLTNYNKGFQQVRDFARERRAALAL